MTEQPESGVMSANQRGAVITAARSLVGTPFLHQGRDPAVGLDCQGFLLAVGAFARYQFTRVWPNTHRRQGNNELLSEALEVEFRRLRSFDHAQPADVILIRLPRRDNLHVTVLAEGLYGTELIHSLAFDGDGRVTAEPIRRWLGRIVASYSWRPEQFEI